MGRGNSSGRFDSGRDGTTTRSGHGSDGSKATDSPGQPRIREVLTVERCLPPVPCYHGRMGAPATPNPHCLRAGMVGLGMIFDETYRPLFEQLHAEGLYRRDFGLVEVELAAVASRTGQRAERYRRDAAGRVGAFTSFSGPDSVRRLVAHGVDAV